MMVGFATKKEQALFDLAVRIIQDECPPDQSFHLCQAAEEYYDGICEDCWRRCVMAAAGGAGGVYIRRKKAASV